MPASTDEAANATEYPASTTGEIGIGQVVLSAVLVLVSLALTAFAGVTLWWTMHAWRTPETLAGHPVSGAGRAPGLRLLSPCPGPARGGGLEHTLDCAWLALDPPGLRDHRRSSAMTTRARPRSRDAAAERAPGPRSRWSSTTTRPRTSRRRSTRRCRTAAATSWGSSTPRTRCTRSCCAMSTHASARHRRRRRAGRRAADELPLQLVSACATAWSTSSGSAAACTCTPSKGFIPLGGNTVFVRTELLRDVGGWDGDCLAEDCELGVRLSRRGARSSSPTTRTWSPGRRRPDTLKSPAQAAHPLEPGLPAGAAQGRMAAAADAAAADARPLHAGHAVPAGVRPGW